MNESIERQRQRPKDSRQFRNAAVRRSGSPVSDHAQSRTVPNPGPDGRPIQRQEQRPTRAHGRSGCGSGYRVRANPLCRPEGTGATWTDRANAPSEPNTTTPDDVRSHLEGGGSDQIHERPDQIERCLPGLAAIRKTILDPHSVQSRNCTECSQGTAVALHTGNQCSQGPEKGPFLPAMIAPLLYLAKGEGKNDGHQRKKNRPVYASGHFRFARRWITRTQQGGQAA